MSASLTLELQTDYLKKVAFVLKFPFMSNSRHIIEEDWTLKRPQLAFKLKAVLF